MYQLLIVDDEPLVQAGIRSMLNWNEMNIEICGTAMNGQAALKIIEEKSTDIVITKKSSVKCEKYHWFLRSLFFTISILLFCAYSTTF